MRQSLDAVGALSLWATSGVHLTRAITAYFLRPGTRSGVSPLPTMAGLISPRPMAYHQPQLGNYQKSSGLSNYSGTPPISTPGLGGIGSSNMQQHGGGGIPHHNLAGTPGAQQFGLGSALNGSATPGHEDSKIYALVIELMDPNTREAALLELSKKREQYDDLALVLWHSFGTCILPVDRMSARSHVF